MASVMAADLLSPATDQIPNMSPVNQPEEASKH